ncbi:MAG: hypothetical protein ACRDBY_03955 [Cetobacterium sp.]
MECIHYKICKNANKCCYKCYEEMFLKLPKEKTIKNKKIFYNDKKANAKDSWKDLEKQVAVKLNNIPDIKEARRSRMSGALEFEKGDVVDTILHPECKERIGNIIKNGADKSFSIKKSWLDKAKEEAKHDNKTMCLPFRFKGDESIHCVIDMDDLAELIVNYKSLKRDFEILENELKLYTIQPDKKFGDEILKEFI